MPFNYDSSDPPSRLAEVETQLLERLERDLPKSDALLARLRAKYPEAGELKHDIGAT